MTEDETSKALIVVFLNVRRLVDMKELLNIYKITSVTIDRDTKHKQEAVYKVLTTSAISGELRELLNNYYDKERQINIFEHVEMTMEPVAQYKRHTLYDAQDKAIYTLSHQFI